MLRVSKGKVFHDTTHAGVNLIGAWFKISALKSPWKSLNLVFVKEWEPWKYKMSDTIKIVEWKDSLWFLFVYFILFCGTNKLP